MCERIAVAPPQVKLPLTKELVCMEQRHDLLAVGSVGHVTLLDPRRWGGGGGAFTPPCAALAWAHVCGGWGGWWVVCGVQEAGCLAGGSCASRQPGLRTATPGLGLSQPGAHPPHSPQLQRALSRRRTADLCSVASPDESQGVRSVQLTEHLLSFGTGRGKLFFFDLRASAFLPTEPAPQHAFDYGGEGGLPRCKLAPALAPAWQPRQHLQLGPGHVVLNDLYYDHFAGEGWQLETMPSRQLFWRQQEPLWWRPSAEGAWPWH